jgi:hypothetical protein
VRGSLTLHKQLFSDTAGRVHDIVATFVCHPAITNDSGAILATGKDVEEHVPNLIGKSWKIGKNLLKSWAARFQRF